jgi:hypothetical protein
MDTAFKSVSFGTWCLYEEQKANIQNKDYMLINLEKVRFHQGCRRKVSGKCSANQLGWLRRFVNGEEAIILRAKQIHRRYNHPIHKLSVSYFSFVPISVYVVFL